MNKYNDKEISIFRRVISDYDLLKKEIDERIEKGYNLENLHDYIRHLSSCSISNYEENEYIDFYYCDMLVSIYNDNNELYLGDTIEIWNDEDMYYIGVFNNIKEIKEAIRRVKK